MPAEGKACVIDLIGNFDNTYCEFSEGISLLDIAAIYLENEAKWKSAFITSLGKVNSEQASLEWWAYGTSSKNFLSSGLGNKVFQLLAIFSVLREQQVDLPLCIIGASAAQKFIVQSFLDQKPQSYKPRNFIRATYFSCVNAFRAFRLIISLVGKKKPLVSPDVSLLTYTDERCDGSDLFFGNLIRLIYREQKDLKVQRLCYINGRFEPIASKILKNNLDMCPLFCFLTTTGVLRSLMSSMSMPFESERKSMLLELLGLDFTPLLMESLVDDLESGQYFNNMLVYYATVRMLKEQAPTRLIYPYENKSLEKILLLAARKQRPEMICIGYQHTSVTPRHTTLMFAEGEAESTPLPDAIVTVGSVTRSYLETYGNYPVGIFRTGCALRQKSVEALGRRASSNDEEFHVLVALSSSKRELIQAVLYCKQAWMINKELRFAIRPHPEFPLSLLPADLHTWLENYAVDFSGTELSGNLSWCDVCVYVSSTVALEVMMIGRPVINVLIGDAINPDPVLTKLMWHQVAITPEELVNKCETLKEVSPSQFIEESNLARAYVQNYLKVPSDGDVKEFLL